MSTLDHIPERYSADISLWLDCAQGRFPLAQVGDSFIMSDSPLTLPAGEAIVCVSVDGQVFPRAVRLSGMEHGAREAMITPNDGIPI